MENLSYFCSRNQVITDMKKIFTCLLAALGLNTACGQQDFENKDVNGFSELIADTNVVVLDVRTASEFEEGHIKNATNIDYNQNDFLEKAKAALPTDKTIAVYCRSGRRSANAAGKLSAEGYQVVNLKGGIIAWTEAFPTRIIKKVYDEDINPLEQIEQAVAKAKTEGKNVICQVGGNWCPWCLRFAYFITNDSTISKVIADNYVYIHVNYNPKKSSGEAKKEQAEAMMKRLGDPGKYGYPVLVVLNGEGQVIHIQETGVLEEGKDYNQEKVMTFFNSWKP